MDALSRTAIAQLEADLMELAGEMEQMGDTLQFAESHMGIKNAHARGSEMKGAADMAREWAENIRRDYMSNK